MALWWSERPQGSRVTVTFQRHLTEPQGLAWRVAHMKREAGKQASPCCTPDLLSVGLSRPGEKGTLVTLKCGKCSTPQKSPVGRGRQQGEEWPVLGDQGPQEQWGLDPGLYREIGVCVRGQGLPRGF